ncbi:MAG: peptidoglycan DL-endopeptidase CwlO [Gaiellaceae bacterium]|jgi:cell wall-associated NlpC family hydrolase|nr:peptidoglycan DL-endopeptidase CwlO [Gaiellaceae bacterium]
MLRSRLLISVLFVAFSLGLALLKPLSGRADGGTPPTPPDPTPPTNTLPIIPAFPAVQARIKAKRKATRTTQSHLAFGMRVVDYAKRFRGVRYVYGGSSPRSGFDCSGFVRYVYAHFGVSLAHSSYAQFGIGRRVGRASLRPGDLVFFDGLGHVGIYIGNGRFIHAPHTGTRVRIQTLGGWYSSRFDGARRLRTT